MTTATPDCRMVTNPYSQRSSIDLGYVPNAQEALKETQVAIVAEPTTSTP